MTWDFVEQNTFSLVFPSQKLYFYPDLSIELELQCFWKTLKLARSALSTSRPFLRRRYLFSFLQRKNVLRRNGMNYTSMDRRNVKVLRDMGQKMEESRIFCIQAILTDCSKAKSTRSRESRIRVTRMSKMTSDV